MALCTSTNKPTRWEALSITVLCLGFFLRLRQYAFNRSLWLDEASLAANVVSRSVKALLSTPLEWDQGAPLGFLLFAKCATWLVGTTDLALRSVPLIAGLLAPIVAFRLSFISLRHPIARFCFVSLVSFAPILVYYSSEFKQYSSDVTIALLIVWLGSKFSQKRWRRGAVVLALVGTVGIWVSHPSIFVLAGVGSVLAVEMGAKDPRAIKALTMAGLWWALNLVAAYYASLRTLAHNDYLVQYWSMGYAPWPITVGRELLWYWESALGVVYLAFRQSGLVGIDSRPEWFSGLSIVLLLLTILGMACLFMHSRRQFCFLLVTISVAVAASAFRLYPFRSRLILFIVPFLHLAASSLVDWLSDRTYEAVRLLGGCVAVGLVSLAVVPSFRVAIHPHNYSDIKGALAYVKAHRAPKDLLALDSGTRISFEFYSQRSGLENMPVIAYPLGTTHCDRILKSLPRRKSRCRVWIVVSHRFNERHTLLGSLRRVAREMDAWEGDGAGAYLFDVWKR